MSKDLRYLQDMNFEEMTINELLEVLESLWLLDPQCPGECPTCGAIHGQLLKAFRKLSDSDLIALLDKLSDEQLHQIAAPLDELQEERIIISDYVKY